MLPRMCDLSCHVMCCFLLQQWGEGSGFFKLDWGLIMLLKTDSPAIRNCDRVSRSTRVRSKSLNTIGKFASSGVCLADEMTSHKSNSSCLTFIVTPKINLNDKGKVSMLFITHQLPASLLVDRALKIDDLF